jgi:gamma-butyrobetaine dioxygenase
MPPPTTAILCVSLIAASIVISKTCIANFGAEARLADGESALELTVGERSLRFPAVWLRDNCACAECVDPGSGQKLKDITEIPDALLVAAAEVAGDSVVVTYAPDRHRSMFSRSWLAEHALDADGDGDGDGRTEDQKELWLPADLDRPEGSWPRYLADPKDRARCLDAVLRRGFVLLHGVPAEAGLVLEVAASFGFVRETNYGRLFDVRVEPSPGNLAYTARPIRPHTDNPYRDPVPTVQLLHCLRAAAKGDAEADKGDGGDTGLVDGFAAARDLRARDAEAFEVLTRTAVPFGYRDHGTDLRASQPLIQLSPRGRIRAVRFNNRSTRPLRLPYAEVTAFYAAYRRWAALLAQPERRLNLRLAPGDCLIFDNTRILHARTAFSVSGRRHLQGCYADLDGLASTLAVLRREEAP